jgi:hypothetical protein
LPIIYGLIAIAVGAYIGLWWAFLTMIALFFSFAASVRIIETEASLLMSMLSILRLTRLGSEVEDLRTTRTVLVNKVRALADRFSDPTLPRMFTADDFNRSDQD